VAKTRLLAICMPRLAAAERSLNKSNFFMSRKRLVSRLRRSDPSSLILATDDAARRSRTAFFFEQWGRSQGSDWPDLSRANLRRDAPRGYVKASYFSAVTNPAWLTLVVTNPSASTHSVLMLMASGISRWPSPSGTSL
jgi:hypothetical protein